MGDTIVDPKRGPMPLPSLFAAKENALQLLLNEIYAALREKNVPESHLPEPSFLIAHIVGWVDPKKKDAWIKAYTELEGNPDAPKPPSKGMKMPQVEFTMPEVPDGAKRLLGGAKGLLAAGQAFVSKTFEQKEESSSNE